MPPQIPPADRDARIAQLQRQQRIRALRQRRAAAEPFVGPTKQMITDSVNREVQDKFSKDPYVGIAQLAGAAISSIPTTVAAGLSGAVTAPFIGSEKATEIINTIEGYSYQPSSEAAQVFADKVLSLPEQFADWVGEKVGMGNPLAGAAIKTAILGIPEILGAKGIAATDIARKRAIREVKKGAEKVGVELGSPKMREQIGRTAGERAVVYQGENMEFVVSKLRQEEEALRLVMDDAFTAARQRNASIRTPTIQEVYIKTQRQLEEGNFDVEMMPGVKARLQELHEIASMSPKYTEGPEWAFMEKTPALVRLNKLDLLRQRMKFNPPPMDKPTPYKKWPREDAALTILKKNYDEAIQKAFDEDMIVGDPQALDAWKNAYKIAKEYKDVFDSDRTITRLIGEVEASGQDMRRWVFGASTAGFKMHSLRVLERIKKIVGEDSPEWAGLRAEFVYDVVEPLLREVPDLPTFINRYERTITNNREVVNSLAPYNTTGIDELYKLSVSAVKTGGDIPLTLNFNRIVSQAVFGHQIAKAAMRRSLAEAFITRLRGTGMSEQKAMIRDILGYDPYKSFIPKNSLAFGSYLADQAIEAMKETEEELP